MVVISVELCNRLSFDDSEHEFFIEMSSLKIKEHSPEETDGFVHY